jgi:hypothetical protein
MFTSLLDRTTLKLQYHLEKLEVRLGLLGASICVSLLLLLLAGIYCAPALELVNHGLDYGKLAVDPLDPERGNRFQYRILTPLVGFILFLKGTAFIALPLLFAAALVATIYWHYRRSSIDAFSVLGICCLMVFSSPILFTLHFAGYVDTTSYFLLFLCYILRRQPIWVSLCYALALLNHESNVFALPWLILLAGYDTESSTAHYLRITGATLAAFLPFLLFRYVFRDTTDAMQMGFFLNKANVTDSVLLQYDYLVYGIFQSFKLFWIVPVVAALLALKKQEHHTAILITCIIACAGLQLFFASDTSRLVGLAFPAVLIGAREISKSLDHVTFRRALFLLIGVNLLLPQAFVGVGIVIPFYSLPVALYMKCYMGIDVWETAWI